MRAGAGTLMHPVWDKIFMKWVAIKAFGTLRPGLYAGRCDSFWRGPDPLSTLITKMIQNLDVSVFYFFSRATLLRDPMGAPWVPWVLDSQIAKFNSLGGGRWHLGKLH